MPKGSFENRRAFTLIELMVVVAIVTVLIALLLPALINARRSAHWIACSSSLRQIDTAFVLYANDNHEYFPVSDAVFPLSSDGYDEHWYSALGQYIGRQTFDINGSPNDPANVNKIFWGCPDWNDIHGDVMLTKNGTKTGYAMNFTPQLPLPSAPKDNNKYYEGDPTQGHYYKFTQITLKSRRVLLGDATDWWTDATTSSVASYVPPTYGINNGDPRRHMNRLGNYLFFDHSVHSLPYESAYLYLWNPTTAPPD